MTSNDSHDRNTDRRKETTEFRVESSKTGRRNLLKSGSLLGVIAMLGSGGLSGSVVAQESGDDDTSEIPASSPWNDDDADGQLETDEEFSGIDIGSLTVVPEETDPSIGVVPKELVTQKDRTIYVDPSGDDSNPGTKDAPVATIQEAVNRIPLFILHSITISIAKGEYTAPKESPAVHAGPFVLKGEGDLNIVGQLEDTDAMYDQIGRTRPPFDGTLPDPSDVYVDVGINWTGFGKLEHMRILNVHWGFLSQFAGHAFVSNCEFRGNGLAAISGKNGQVYFELSDIGDPCNDQFGVWGVQLERMYFERTTIGATDAALLVYNGDMYQLGQEMDIDAPTTFLMDPGSVATHGTNLYVGGENVNGPSDEAESISPSDRPVF